MIKDMFQSISLVWPAGHLQKPRGEGRIWRPLPFGGGQEACSEPSFSCKTTSPQPRLLAASVCGRNAQTPVLPPPGRDSLPFLLTHPRRGSSKQKVIVDRKRGQIFPSPAGFLGTKTATQDNKECRRRSPEGAGGTPASTPAARLPTRDPTGHMTASLTIPVVGESDSPRHPVTASCGATRATEETGGAISALPGWSDAF